MNRKLTAPAILVSFLALAATLTGATAATAAPAETQGDTFSPQSCFGSEKGYYKPRGGARWPNPGFLTTTSNCADINLKPYTSVSAQVCFSNGSCSTTKFAPAGTYTVLASGVRDGTRYYINFFTSNEHSGLIAD